MDITRPFGDQVLCHKVLGTRREPRDVQPEYSSLCSVRTHEGGGTDGPLRARPAGNDHSTGAGLAIPADLSRLWGAWKTLLGLCRLAGLRQGEALALRWDSVDWDRGRLTVWATKTKRQRLVPIVPELLPLLQTAAEGAAAEANLIIEGLVMQNLWRDFRVICKRAGIEPYAKWCHTLRKNRESDWMAVGFPFHVVVDWMGHSDEVARQHYLRVNDADLDAATQTQIGAGLTQKLTQIGDSEPETGDEDEPQIFNLEEFRKQAGDRIRTDDVQLGNSLLGAQTLYP